MLCWSETKRVARCDVLILQAQRPIAWACENETATISLLYLFSP